MGDAGKEFQEFSLLGGPLHRLGVHLGLVRRGTNTLALGLASGAFLWIVLVALALGEGGIRQAFSLSVIGAHVRLLVAVPLLFACEAFVDPMVAHFVRQILRTKLVQERELPALHAEVSRVMRWNNAWPAEAICLLAAVFLSLSSLLVPLPGATTAYAAERATAEMTMAGLWYRAVCLTLFRFLVFRWLWRLCGWSYFLWRIARLELRLVPTHPDGAAGLGFLEVVHSCFTPIVFAISAIQSASLAEEISMGTMPFEGIYPTLAVTLMIDAILFIGPLLIFAPKLWACRVKGLRDYMELSSLYVDGFEARWVRAGTHAAPLLGSPDLQSLADLSHSVSVVRNMRAVPASTRLLSQILVAALLPMLPLLPLRYPIAELAEKFVARLSGL